MKIGKFYKNGVVRLFLTQLEIAIKQEGTHLKLWLNRYYVDVSTNRDSNGDKTESIFAIIILHPIVNDDI